MNTEKTTEDLAKEWLALDQESYTRQEIQELLDAKNTDELEKRLRNRIAFGTAGLRAKMGAGFSLMNSLTVIQTSQGLAQYLIEKFPQPQQCIVIGYDGRHNSEKFARLAAAAFIEKNFKVWWIGLPVHTPFVSFSVGEMRAAAGVMITASHNPPQDNGYKVYWSNSCQIIPPHDSGIAESILKNLTPLNWDKHAIDDSLMVEGMRRFVLDKYLQAIAATVDPQEKLKEIADDRVNFSYTAMHGVGLRAMEFVTKKLGIEDRMKVVKEQAHPDPDFPGLPFPNPEEKGALDMAIWSADRQGTSFVLATDPDGDRLAVAEKVQAARKLSFTGMQSSTETSSGEWHLYTGNELGVLLAAYVFETYTGDKSKLAMVASTVSTSMISAMAEKEGFHYAETLTGFKWIGNKSIELDEQGFETKFGMEEAIGYMLPGVTRDKDGISASALFIAAAAHWFHTKKISPYHKLQDLYKQYGHFESANTYLISPTSEITKEVFGRIRGLGSPEPYPKSLGKRKVLYWRDLTTGWDSSTKDHKPLLPVDGSSEMLTCELEGHVRMTIRGSGTEPKIKIYVECKARSQEAAKQGAQEVQKDAIEEWLSPETFGLTTR
jgi:phosphoglucomutase